jgi:hypothetical protein
LILLNVLVQKGVVNGNNAVRNLKCAWPFLSFWFLGSRGGALSERTYLFLSEA